MKPQIIIALGIIGVMVGVFVGLADATPPGVVTVRAPLYGATYSSVQQQSATDNSAAILTEVRAIRELLEKSLNAPGGQSAEDSTNITILVKNKCASCHNSRDAGKLGGDFVLYIDEKTPVKLSRPDVRSIVKKVKDGTMPPPDKGKLTDTEKQLFETFFK